MFLLVQGVREKHTLSEQKTETTLSEQKTEGRKNCGPELQRCGCLHFSCSAAIGRRRKLGCCRERAVWMGGTRLAPHIICLSFFALVRRKKKQEKRTRKQRATWFWSDSLVEIKGNRKFYCEVVFPHLFDPVLRSASNGTCGRTNPHNITHLRGGP